MMRTKALFLVVAVCASTVYAENWSNWRGPSYNGSSPEKNLPSEWSKTKNIAWSADLPGPASATPAVWGDHVFVSSTDASSKTLKALCFNRKNGQLVWQHDVSEGIRRDRRSTFAGPSPATDGKVVVFFYGNGDMVAYDFMGKEQWKKNVGPFAFLWTFSTSPVIYEGKLYLQVLQRDTPVDGRGQQNNDSYLLAMDPQTGKELWRKVRPSKARKESLEAFTTPMPYEHNGRKMLLINGGDAVTAHDPKTGEEIWRWGTWNPERITHWRLVPSPVAGDGIVLACAPKREPIYAIRAGKEGMLDNSAIAWVSKDERVLSSDVPTPAFYQGDFFVLSDVRKTLSRIEPETGKIKWSINTPGRSKYEASPTAADGKIYIVNFDGEVTVVNADNGEIISTIPMEDERTADVVRSSVVISQGQLFIRGTKKLFCVGK